MLVAREAEIAIGPGPKTKMFTYNGTFPGPTIEGDVGDLLIVHFYNFLPEPTIVHWHGAATPAAMDGSHVSQWPVPPLGYFRYEFRLLHASTQWYHPHVRTNVQVERGMYGALIVRDPAEDARLALPGGEAEHVLLLDDIDLDARLQIKPPYPDDLEARVLTQLNGREGDTLLVNGRPDLRHELPAGKPQRLRLINAANSRFMRLSFGDAEVWRIGGDGGLLERAQSVTSVRPFREGEPPERHRDPSRYSGLLLTPGERADVVVVPRGKTLRVDWHDYPRGRHSVSMRPDGRFEIGHSPHHMTRRALLRWPVAGESPPDAAPATWTPPERLSELEPIDIDGAESIVLTLGHTMPDETGEIAMFLHGSMHDPIPFMRLSADVAPMVHVGDTRIWEVHNTTAAAHNFHTHGWSFQAIDLTYRDLDDPAAEVTIPYAEIEDKDTILIPGRPGKQMGRSVTILRLAARFDDDGREGQVLARGKLPGDERSGGWLIHCHILEHSTNGMMSFLQVVPAGERIPPRRIEGMATTSPSPTAPMRSSPR